LRRIASSLIIALLFLSLFVLAFNVQTARAQTGTIYINPNGSITPSTANITTSDRVTYTFTGNNYLPIVVNRSNIIINGMGHTLQAPGGTGFSLTDMSNITIKSTSITNSGIGIDLESSSGNVLSGNNVTANSNYGIHLGSSSGNTLSGNKFTANYYSIWLGSSSGNVLSGNSVTANSRAGIFLNYSCDNNTLSGNKFTANYYGIYVYRSSGNTLSGNSVTANTYGIYLDSSSGNVLSGNNVTTNSNYGIYLDSSSGNVLSGNNVTANSEYGILIWYSSDNNTLSGNSVTANSEYGILIWFSSDNNTLSGNSVTANSWYGIDLWSSSGNTFYHNNFINNTLQVSSDGSPSTWDNGYPSGGNYWSDYRTTYPNATENDSSGIWNTPYVIGANNTDRYPLIAPFGTFSVVTWSGVAYSVDTVSNSTITDLSFNATAKTLTFNVTGANGTTGFCRVAIPKKLMWCTNLADWIVTVNSKSPLYINITTDRNNTYIYFTYHHSTEKVQITSTSAIPEFQQLMLLPLLMIITLLTATASKRKRSVKK
jgi:parallel beta-helix repeat protein